MNIYELLILSVALAIDAMLVSFSYGLVLCEKRLKNSVILASFFGFFQFLMPVMGALLTGFVYEYTYKFSKIIVFTIFMFLALKFLKEAFFEKDEKKTDCISILCVLTLAVATSIDALGAGISIALLDVNVIKASIIIGIITFILSFLGFHLGNLFCKIEKKYIETTGALLLIYLAVKSVIF